MPIVPAAGDGLDEGVGERLARFMRPGALSLATLPPLSLYVHLPWCLKKCPYCDFNSHAWRGGERDALPEARYVDALIRDLEASLPFVWGRGVHTVFIGGGTPSLFSPTSIERLVDAIRARLPLDPGCEISLEANPGTFERERFRDYAKAGVTRLSIGVAELRRRQAARSRPRPRRGAGARGDRGGEGSLRDRSTSTSCTRCPARRSPNAKPMSRRRSRSRRPIFPSIT